MPQAVLHYKVVTLPLEHFLVIFHLKTPLDHGSIQFKSLEFKKKKRGKGEDEGSEAGRQQSCAYSELDKGFIATNCSIWDQPLGHSFLVTAGMPRTPSCFLRK